ncbi:MAG: (d)CMP kinase [Geodermatophilaceae bacterium]
MTAYGPADVIAVDGPSGTGKSTVSRAVARALGWRYLDTGAMYRAATWLVLQAGVPVEQASALVRRHGLQVGTDPEIEDVVAMGRHVEAAIRSPEVTAAVSAVSAVPELRSLLVDLQRAAIGAGRIVVEGRDIGSVVVPDARLQVYLTAEPDVRAVRRAQETAGDAAATGAALRRRDALDGSRAASPLRPAPHAVVVDSTALTQEQVVEHILTLARLVLT